MKVTKLELENIKAYEKAEIELSPTINLITGANNSGKSTIIKALQNLQYGCIFQSDVRAKKDSCKIVYTFSDVSKDEKELFFNNNNALLRKAEYFKACWSMYDIPSSPTQTFSLAPGDFTFVHTRAGLTSLNPQGSQMGNVQFNKFQDSENKNNFIYPFLAKRKTDFYDSNTNSKDFYKVLDGFRHLGAKIQKLSNPSLSKSKRFNTLCEEILGFQIGLVPSENQNGYEPGVHVDDSTIIPLRAMGEGVANVVGLLVILLTENNKLFLIEELENDIHPEALKKLLALIVEKSQNNQFVISTHSHIVLKYLGAVPKSKIFYTEWKLIENDEIRTPTSSILEIENTPQKRIEILEKLGYELFDFELHEGYLLLEESTAETLIRDFLIPNFVPGLYGRLKTIAAKGVDDLEAKFSDFHRLFVFIHLNQAYYKKAWVCADGDTPGKDILNRLRSKFQTWPDTHFQNFKMESFEQYYPKRFENQANKVLEMKHGKPKQEEKAKLIKEVMAWALKDKESAIAELKVTAKEIISFLKDIEKSLKAQTTTASQL